VSDEIAYDVESGPGPADPAPEPVAETPAPEPAAAAPAAPEAVEPGTVEVGGQHMVPLGALLAERRTAATLKQKAEQLDQIAAEWAQLKPYAEFVRANPDLMKPREAPAPAPVQPEQDEQLITLARTLDLYTPEGKPDATRAATIRNLVKSEAQSIAQEAVKPLHEQTTHERAQTNFRNALALDFNGVKPNPQVLQHIWRTTDPKVLATEQGAAAAALMAMGLGAVTGAPTPAAVAAPTTIPVVTEPAGGRNVNRPAVSEFEQRVMQVRGLDPKKYAEATRNFRPGEHNTLED
jgi:hypothetical protein